MRNLGKIAIFLFVQMGMVYANSVEASVDTQEITKGMSVTFQIEAKGGNATFPEIDEIAGVAVQTLGTSTQSSMKILNGSMQTESSTTRRYQLTPEHNMTIPAYQVSMGTKEYTTKPITLTVGKPSATQTRGDDSFNFTIETDKKELYVGESLIVTMTLSIADKLRGVQISEYAPPSSKHFFIKEVEGQRDYKKNGFSYIAKQYILTAKSEGNFTINAAHVKLGLPDRRRQDVFGRYGMRWTQKVSNVLPLHIQAVENNADLLGSFELEKTIDSKHVKANTPVNLTLVIRGEGNLEDFVYKPYEIDGVTIYSDDAKVESHIQDNTLQSEYRKSFVFISDHNFTIPARSITMYNPKTKETSTLEVPRYDISVMEARVSRTAHIAKGAIQQNKSIAPKPVTIEKRVEVKSVAWWMLVLAFALGAMMMAVVSWLPKWREGKRKAPIQGDALQRLYGHIGEDPEVEAMVRKLYAKKAGDKSVEIDKKVLNEMLKRFD